MSEHDEAKQPGGGAPRRRRRSRRRSSRPSGSASSGQAPKQQPTTDSSSDQGTRPVGGSGSDAAEGGAQRARRRPNRRRRGRGGQRQHTSDAQQSQRGQQSAAATQSDGSASTTGSSGAAGSANAANSTGGSNSASGEQPRKKANRSRRRRNAGGQQPQNRRQQRGRGRAQAHRPPRNRMQTSDETSAGGLVVSGMAEAVRADGSVDLNRIYVALIGRLDRRGRLLWSMPKGHVEPGEDRCATAEREVWEETGIECEVFADLGTIDYWFVSEGTRIHKTVHHHLLRFVDGDLNDEDPEVTEVSWIPVGALLEKLAYADERKLARRAHDLLPDLARAEKEAGRATPR